MKAKMVIKDVARAMGVPVAEANRLSSMVNEKTLDESIKANGELARTIEGNTVYQELFRHAGVLEGLARQAGMHAGGVIIAPGEVVNWAPLFKQPGADTVMTQFDMNFVEKVGLIKMDFLGLRTLTVLQETIRLIRKYHGKVIDLWKLPDGDQTTYELFGKGETTGVFQFESQGMQDYLESLSRPVWKTLSPWPLFIVRDRWPISTPLSDVNTAKRKLLTFILCSRKPGGYLWSNHLPGAGDAYCTENGRILSWSG
jgi:DNA polymerase-3 subunit alpha